MKQTLLILLVLIPTHVFSQKSVYQNLDHYLSHVENNNLGVGSVSVYKAGKEVYHKSFGQKNIPGLVYGDDTRYHVGSVTKLITATLIFKLIEEGKLKPEDKLSGFYPEIPNAEKITIKNLLEHTSGLGSYVVKNGEVWVTKRVSDKEIMEVIIQQGVRFEPGEKTAYSNTAYYLLTKILEKIQRKPFHDLVKDTIANPYHLSSLASIKTAPKNAFEPYQFKDNEWKPVTDEIDFLNVVGVGDMVATTKDLNIFLHNLFSNKIISAASLASMLPVLPGESWGRGIAVWEFDGIVFYGHGGDTLGSHALVIYNPENNLSISYATNGERINKEDFVKYLVLSLYDKEFQLPGIR